MLRLKKVVFTQRIRMKDFILDFDKLRSGYVHVNHFMSALGLAGIDKFLSPAEIQAITAQYTVDKTNSLQMVDYRAFLGELDSIFTSPNLEKNPLVEVAAEPQELLDRQRYLRSSRALEPETEAALDVVLHSIADKMHKWGTPVKPFFDDAAADDNSAKQFGHVTVAQFKQVLVAKLGLELTSKEQDLLVQKFHHDDKLELVNYIAFANTVEPQDPAFNPYDNSTTTTSWWGQH